MKTFTSSFEDSRLALVAGFHVYAKDSMGDWIKIDAINAANGRVRAADALSGHNSCIVGQWFIPRDLEIQ